MHMLLAAWSTTKALLPLSNLLLTAVPAGTVDRTSPHAGLTSSMHAHIETILFLLLCRLLGLCTGVLVIPQNL